MRLSAILAIVLATVLNTAAAACVSDLGAMSASRCGRKARVAEQRSQIHNGNGCAESVKRAPDTCRMRGFARTPVAALAPAERLQVKLAPAIKIVTPGTPRIIASSVGPPETDRGPPRS